MTTNSTEERERIRRHEMTSERWEELQGALDRPEGPTDAEAEEVLRHCGTSGREVVNNFIEHLLNENRRLSTALFDLGIELEKDGSVSVQQKKFHAAICDLAQERFYPADNVYEATKQFWPAATSTTPVDGEQEKSTVTNSITDEERIAQIRERQADLLDRSAAGDGACSCLYTTPCDPRCTCVYAHSSRGCARCCSYGSKEQRRANAARLAALIDGDAATRMRDLCVEKVNHKIRDLSRTVTAAQQNAGKIYVLTELRDELSSLTLGEQEKTK